MNMDNGYYRTKDLAEVGALIIKKQKLIEMQRDKNICWFVFKNNQDCRKISSDFYFGNLTVNAREYSEIMRMLKGKVSTY